MIANTSLKSYSACMKNRTISDALATVNATASTMLKGPRSTKPIKVVSSVSLSS